MTSALHFGKREGFCDECGLEAERLCGGCKIAIYCGTMCAKIAWKGHRKDCKEAQARAALLLADPAASPTLPTFATDQRIDVADADLAIYNKATGKTWLEETRNDTVGANAKHTMELIKAYGANPDIAFTPAIPDKPFQQAFVTLARLFFIHTISHLSPEYIHQLSYRLRCTPGFTGEEVDDPKGLNKEIYEALMRNMHSTLYGLVDAKVLTRWETLGEAGVKLWEQT